MAEVEVLREAERESAGAGSADLLVALPEPQSNEALSSLAASLLEAAKLLPRPCSIILAVPGDPSLPQPPMLHGPAAPNREASTLSIQTFSGAPPAAGSGIPWLAHTAAYGPIAAMAAALGARACTVLDPDFAFASGSLSTEKLALLVDPALEGNFDLVMPLYSSGAFDELVNKSTLYPLTRALYGQRVQHPLSTQFEISSRLFSAVAADGVREADRKQGRQPWLCTMAVNKGLKICQVKLGTRRSPAAEGIELSDALAQLVGPLFLEMEDTAALWQRIRGSHEVPTFGEAVPAPPQADAVDPRHMLEAFQLGVNNLREIWSGILPPVTLLDLKKLAAMPPDQFHMQDALWARILYDFALAHRLRNIHRGHLFGALTPLYLGWVASYAVAVNRGGPGVAQTRLEALARTFESEKPYLLSRWRWPDRFQP